MRIFYEDEGPTDTLLQVAAGPVRDGDLVSKTCRDEFVKHGWAAHCHGWNVITPVGENAIRMLKLRRPRSKDAEALPMTATAPWAEGSAALREGRRLLVGAVVQCKALNSGLTYRVVAVSRDAAWLRVNEHDVLGVTAPVRELTFVSW